MFKKMSATHPKTARGTIALSLLLSIFLCLPAHSKKPAVNTVSSLTPNSLPKEYKIKAAYLLNMILYISWPEESVQNKTTINLCVDQHEKFSLFLRQILTSKKNSPRMDAINILELKPNESPTHCDMYYKLKLKPDIEPCKCLTIGDNIAYRALGTTINFYEDKRRIRFEINRQKIEESKIKIRSELLKLARLL